MIPSSTLMEKSRPMPHVYGRMATTSMLLKNLLLGTTTQTIQISKE